MRFVFLATLLAATSCSSATHPAINSLQDLGARLETLRAEYKIPALAAGVLEEDGTIWFHGMGQTADGAAPTRQSVFHLASLTKSFASAIVLQLVEQNKLSLTDNVAKFGVSFANSPDIQVVHLMTHTSEGVPGTSYRYNGDRYAALDQVIRTVSGQSFVNRARQEIIGPLGLSCTGPASNPVLRARLVPGFEPNGSTRVPYPTIVSSAAGFVSCVDDMLKFSDAWDDALFLQRASVERAWTAARNSQGAALPYGLGWFVAEIDGEQVIWHYGWWTGISSLIIKIPARHVTYVLLANSDQLNRNANFGSGDLQSLPFARAFLSWAMK